MRLQPKLNKMIYFRTCWYQTSRCTETMLLTWKKMKKNSGALSVFLKIYFSVTITTCTIICGYADGRHIDEWKKEIEINIPLRLVLCLWHREPSYCPEYAIRDAPGNNVHYPLYSRGVGILFFCSPPFTLLERKRTAYRIVWTVNDFFISRGFYFFVCSCR